jgi:cholestenol Delta-isomerase
MATTSHPFYPLGIALANFTERDISVLAIFSAFIAALLCLFTAARAYISTSKTPLSPRDSFLATWFVLTGFIHLIIEGYFSIHHATMPSRTDSLGAAWKLYALCDSRYMTADAFVVCMETVTAWCWGPLSLLMTYLIVQRSPWRHAVQIVVSGGQFYGDALYFMTSFFEEWRNGLTYSRPEPIYYWGFFVGMNVVWLVIPGCKFCALDF